MIEVIEVLVPSVGTVAAQQAAEQAEAARDATFAAIAAPMVVRVVSGTAAAVTDDDHGKVLRFMSDDPVTVSVDPLSAGFRCVWVQEGEGQITYSAATGAMLRNVHGYFRSYGQDAQGAIIATEEGIARVSGDLTL